MLKCLLVVCICAASTLALKLPSYITPCKVDGNLNKCAVETANSAISKILDGDAKYGIPKLDPLKVSQINLDTGNLKIVFSDATLTGLAGVHIDDIQIDPSTRKWKVKASTSKPLTVVGQYDANGKILILPITGKGPAEVIFETGKYEYETVLKPIQRDGKEYVELSNPKMIFYPGKTHYKLDNLFNGDKTLGDEMNKFLNENYEDVNKDLSGAFGEAIATVINSILSGIIVKVPYEEIFA